MFLIRSSPNADVTPLVSHGCTPPHPCTPGCFITNYASVGNMPQASARIVQNGRKSSQLPDCKRDEGVKCHPTDRSLSIATRPEIVPPNKSNRGRSLLPKKTAPNKSPNRSVLQDDTNHTSAVVRRNARVVQNAFSNPHITKEFISSNTIEKEGLSSLQAPKIPVKNLETSFSARKRGIGIPFNYQGRQENQLTLFPIVQLAVPYRLPEQPIPPKFPYIPVLNHLRWLEPAQIFYQQRETRPRHRK